MLIGRIGSWVDAEWRRRVCRSFHELFECQGASDSMRRKERRRMGDGCNEEFGYVLT